MHPSQTTSWLRLCFYNRVIDVRLIRGVLFHAASNAVCVCDSGGRMKPVSEESEPINRTARPPRRHATSLCYFDSVLSLSQRASKPTFISCDVSSHPVVSSVFFLSTLFPIPSPSFSRLEVAALIQLMDVGSVVSCLP